jgi:hypothetical protein
MRVEKVLSEERVMESRKFTRTEVNERLVECCVHILDRFVVGTSKANSELTEAVLHLNRAIVIAKKDDEEAK